jgi:hypothetical protein
MSLDMAGLMLRSMGVDPQAVVGSIQDIAAGAAQMTALVDAMRTDISELLENQRAIMAHLGMSVPMTAATMSLIADQSARYLAVQTDVSKAA